MAKMTCAKCGKEWQEPGFPGTTLCDECLQKQRGILLDTDDFQATVYNILTDEEIELIKGVDWNELKIIAAEYIALQLRWKLFKLKGCEI